MTVVMKFGEKIKITNLRITNLKVKKIDKRFKITDFPNLKKKLEKVFFISICFKLILSRFSEFVENSIVIK